MSLKIQASQIKNLPLFPFIVKSDRINVLRKQYDSLLEDEKKRRERNEFILGRLDKMRSCTAVVPARLTTSPLLTHINDDTRNLQLIRPSPKALSLNVLPKIIDEAHLLQEISKKYILIPKTSTLSNDYDMYPVKDDVPDENTDWKSKYDILDEIKKDTQDTPTREDDFSENEFIMTGSQKHVSKLNKYKKSQQENSGDGEMDSFKDLSLQENVYTDPIYNTSADNFATNEDLKTSFVETSNQVWPKEQTPIIKSKAYPEKAVAAEINIGEQPIQYQDPFTTYETESLQRVQPKDSSNVKLYSTDNQISTNLNKKSFIEDDISSVQILNQYESTQGSYNEAVTEEDYKQPDKQYPIQIIEAKEFTPNDDLELHDGVNINPDGVILAQNTQDHIDPYVQEIVPQSETLVTTGSVAVAEGIQEFEKEQNEMFYDEQPEGYIENQASDANYQPEAEYVYYENNQQDQAYPAEINAHDETLQKYDQSYEEQYAYNEGQVDPKHEPYEAHQKGVPYEQGVEQQAYVNYEHGDQQYTNYEKVQVDPTRQYYEQDGFQDSQQIYDPNATHQYYPEVPQVNQQYEGQENTLQYEGQQNITQYEGQENTPQYEGQEHIPQYEGQEYYDQTQQGYDQYQQGNYDQQYVQQQLDEEDGYVQQPDAPIYKTVAEEEEENINTSVEEPALLENTGQDLPQEPQETAFTQPPHITEENLVANS